MAKAISLGPLDARNFDKQINSLMEELYDFVIDVNVETKDGDLEVACEFPEFFPNRRGFHTAAGGDLVAMSYCVGRVAGVAYDRLGAKSVKLVKVTTWKGQLPKDVVAKRIRDRIDTRKLTTKMSHDWDACGIALFAKGKF